MKQILQRLAIFSFLGCVTIIGIASYSKIPQEKNGQNWKQDIVKNTGDQESLVEAYTRDYGYELNLAAKALKYFID